MATMQGSHGLRPGQGTTELLNTSHVAGLTEPSCKEQRIRDSEVSPAVASLKREGDSPITLTLILRARSLPLVNRARCETSSMNRLNNKLSHNECLW